jgi:hypothetical protein
LQELGTCISETCVDLKAGWRSHQISASNSGFAPMDMGTGKQMSSQDLWTISLVRASASCFRCLRRIWHIKLIALWCFVCVAFVKWYPHPRQNQGKTRGNNHAARTAVIRV